MPKITLERLHEVLNYNPKTGEFVWRTGRHAGKRAGYLRRDGYVQIQIDRQSFYAHRLAWFYETGLEPPILDHETGDRSWNSMDNLRRADASGNSRNRRVSRTKTSSRRKGVYRRGSKWRAMIWIDGRNEYLGTFQTEDEASAAYYERALLEFGEFARN